MLYTLYQGEITMIDTKIETNKPDKYPVLPATRTFIEAAAVDLMGRMHIPYSAQGFLTKPISEAYQDTVNAFNGAVKDYHAFMARFYSSVTEKLREFDNRLSLNDGAADGYTPREYRMGNIMQPLDNLRRDLVALYMQRSAGKNPGAGNSILGALADKAERTSRFYQNFVR